MNIKELDEELVEVLTLINSKLNLRTKYSCFGHKDEDHLYIMFHEDCDFKEVEAFAETFAKRVSGAYFSFKYWIRSTRNNKVVKNWICETNGLKSVSEREFIVSEIINIANEIINVTGGLDG